MIYSTKYEFMEGLRNALAQNDVNDARDILIDFEQHFDDGAAAGETEAEICGKLGDVDELVKQYISEETVSGEENTAKTVFDGSTVQETGTAGTEKTVFSGEVNSYTYTTQNTGENYNYSGIYGDTNNSQYSSIYDNQYNSQNNNYGATNVDPGKVVGTFCMDVFLYSWALPTLIGLIFGLMGTTIGFVFGGLGSFVGGILSLFVDISGFISTGLSPVSLIFFGLMMASFGGMLVIASIASVRGFINLCIVIINQHARAFTGHGVLNKIGGKVKEAAAQ